LAALPAAAAVCPRQQRPHTDRDERISSPLWSFACGLCLGGNFTSTLKQECVRCLGDAFVSIDIPLDELYFYPEQEAPPGAYTFIGDTGFIDLSDLIRETSFLAVPMRPICRPDCLGLCMECGQNLNEKDCGCTPDEIDPRLAELRQFLE
jgi:uncharacterized protein